MNGYDEETQAGRRIMDLRRERGLSQQKLADLIAACGEPYSKWRQSTIDKIEKRQRPLRVSEIFDLAAVLEVPPERLLFGWDLDDDEAFPALIEDAERRLADARSAHDEARMRVARCQGELTTLYRLRMNFKGQSEGWAGC